MSCCRAQGAVAILGAMIDDASMALDDDLDVDANVDLGKRDGYFVRLDVEFEPTRAIRSGLIQLSSHWIRTSVALFSATSAE